MQALSREEQETLRAILRRVFEEAAVDTLLQALDHLAARGEQGIAALRQWLEGSLAGLQSDVNRLAKGHGSVEEALARLLEDHARLEESHRRLEETLTRLAEAQARTEEALARLAEAQARTEERVARLEEAQARTEERLTRVEEGQRRLEEALARLAEAQAQAEERIARLERLMEQMTRQVGALSDVIGGDLEDAAYIVIHDTFTRELGWKVGVLERAFLRWDDHELEVDIIGRAYDPARPKYEIWIIGETKYNMTVGEVERFAKKLPLILEYLTHQGGEKKERLIVPVCFCYRARPEVRERIYNLGFHLVFSYGRVIWGKGGPPVSRRKKTASRKGAR